MKRIFKTKTFALAKAISLALAIVISLAACGKKDKPDGGASGSQSAYGDVKQADLDQLDEALSAAKEYYKSLGLEEDQFGYTQYGVWNADLLPKCLPGKPSRGIIDMDRTEFKDKKHEEMMVARANGEYHAGNILFPDKKYDRHAVLLNCTKEAIQEFADSMKAAGFGFGKLRIDTYEVNSEWLGNGYYVHLNARGQWEGGKDDFWTVITATSTLGNPHPKSFQGTPLPTAGLVTRYEKMAGNGWDEAKNDSVSDFWDVYNDKGKLPPTNWDVWYEYDFVTLDQAKAYVKTMESAGWKKVYENEDKNWNDEDSYSVQLKKGDIYAAVDAPYDGHDNMVVRFGTMPESLYY
ncbi:MAG: hypothetical protein LBU82_07610 [Treponema sp.]|jgi:hypothetical protein|nr:hypothetical protein [Treponema sp.]